ncbi:MAG: MlaD family protein [Salinivirgaceae bacterium]|nr:MlaD family protein [Salinivirgaceae bacterium]
MKSRILTITGLLAFVAIVGAYVGINYLKGLSVFSHANTYVVSYSRIDGLQKSAHVVVNGFQIGNVSNVYLDPDHSGNITVELTVNQQYTIPKASTAKIYSSDLMGTKAIEIIYSTDTAMMQNGDTLRADFEGSLTEMVSVQMLPLKNKAEDLIKEMQEVMAIISYIFNSETRQNITESFSHIRATIAHLEMSSIALDTIVSGQQRRINRIMSNVEQLAQTLGNQSDNINQSLQNIAGITSDLNNADLQGLLLSIDTVAQSLKTVLATVEQGQGTVGKLMANDTLYYNIQNLCASLNNLTDDLYANPGKYINVSMIGKSKSTVVAPDQTPIEGNSYYRICLMSSRTELQTTDKVFAGYNVVRYATNGTYHYLYGNYKKQNKASDDLAEIKAKFPQACLVEMRGGFIVEFLK